MRESRSDGKSMRAIKFIRPKARRPLTEKKRVARHLESQRREANRPLGFRPRGVSVSFGEIGVNGLHRECGLLANGRAERGLVG